MIAYDQTHTAIICDRLWFNFVYTSDYVNRNKLIHRTLNDVITNDINKDDYNDIDWNNSIYGNLCNKLPSDYRIYTYFTRSIFVIDIYRGSYFNDPWSLICCCMNSGCMFEVFCGYLIDDISLFNKDVVF